MIKGLIAAVVVILVLYGAWEIWLYWDQVSHDRDLAAAKQAAAYQVSEESMSGMPNNLEKSYKAAKAQGVNQWRAWMRQYLPMVADPRRAWIELDFTVAIAHDQPAEARKIFAEVKSRVPENSPVYFRVKALENTYK
jgi:hypothetical protein